MNDAVRQEALEREEIDKNTTQRVSTELEEIEKTLQAEKLAREDGEKKIADYIRELVNNVSNDLLTEKKIRYFL